MTDDAGYLHVESEARGLEARAELAEAREAAAQRACKEGREEILRLYARVQDLEDLCREATDEFPDVTFRTKERLDRAGRGAEIDPDDDGPSALHSDEPTKEKP